MKKYVVLFLLVAAVASAELIQPKNETIQPCIDNQTESLHSAIHVGGCYSYGWITPQGFPSFHGNLGGMQARYEYQQRNFLYEGVKFSWRQGEEHQASNTRALLDFDVHERIGYTFAGTRWSCALFSGLGYRYLGQELRQPGLSDLTFNYNEFYIPVGFIFDKTIASHGSLGLNVIWMPQVYPALTIIPLNGANWIINRTIKNFLVEVPVSFTYSRWNLAFELKPFFEYWQNGKTSAISQFGFALDIPENTYLFFGIELNLGGSF
jgi:hypothetical protein